MDLNIEKINQNPMEEHARTIIHIDIDCFYAQVEILKNPNLKTVPLGIQQKNIVVTSNYLAREYGVKKCMPLSEAKNVCSQLVLVNGEDLKDYREYSLKVNELLRKYSPTVERLGLDENFIDVTNLVKEKMSFAVQLEVVGNIFKIDDSVINKEGSCYCGCYKRLSIGTQIAAVIREAIFTEIGLTTCAGISYNKLLSKIACSTHKPNQQTVLFPEHVSDLLYNLKTIRSIPGVGAKTCEQLSNLNIQNVNELLNYPRNKLISTVGNEAVTKLINLCQGYDPSPVKISGKPQSIGLEDSCKSLNVISEVENKFKQLLTRLIELVIKDGRVPTTVRVTIRKFDSAQKISHREQRQDSISPSLFATNKSLSDTTQKKLLTVIMKLFYKLVDIKKPFYVTLLGLSFTKFQERSKTSVVSLLMKNVTVQEVTSLRNNLTVNTSLPSTSISSSNISPSTSISPVEMGNPSNSSDVSVTDGSESEIEPSPKKTKYAGIIAHRRCLSIQLDSPSPSKLRVAELRLNSTEADRISPNLLEDENGKKYYTEMKCPIGVDESVFKELPPDLQEEIINEHKQLKHSNTSLSTPSKAKKLKTKNSTILDYF